MCGIFGVVATSGTLNYAQSNFLKAATVTGQLRGEDGTGWITRAPSAEVRVFKRALNGNDFLASQQGQQASRLAITSRLVIGHNRKTTSGRDVDADCHPYDYDNVVGVHNGGIPHAALTRLDGTKDTIADVDSAKLYAALNAADDPVDVLKKIHTGAYALAWIDKRTNELLIARNKERPMWASSGEDGMYFASEPGMLFWLMSRFDLDAKDSRLYEVLPNYVYRVNLDDPAGIRRTKYETVAPKPTKSSNTRSDTSGYHGRGSDDSWYSGGRRPPSSKFCSTAKELISKFPSLALYGDVIEENLEYISEAYPDTKEGEGAGRKLDVVVTNVKPSTGGVKYPVLEGYVQDSTNSGITIPVTFNAIKNDDYNFFSKYNKAEKDDTFFTVRGIMNSIRVSVDGDVSVMMRLSDVWDVQHNVVRDLVALTAATDVAEAIKYKSGYNTMSRARLTAKWKELEKPVTTH